MRPALVVALTLCGCADNERYRDEEPWNFPPAVEWNAPLEFSWVNAVDTWRRVSAPEGTIYDPLTRSYQPDFAPLLGYGPITSSSNEPEILPASPE